MNSITLMGRLARDPQVSQIMGQRGPVNVANFPLVVKRNRTNKSFVVMVSSYGNNAAFVQKYLQKGIKVMITGELNSSAYQDPDTGRTTYYTEVIMENAEFAEPKKNQQESQQNTPNNAPQSNGYPGMPPGFMPANAYDNNPFDIPKEMEAELPFC